MPPAPPASLPAPAGAWREPQPQAAIRGSGAVVQAHCPSSHAVTGSACPWSRIQIPAGARPWAACALGGAKCRWKPTCSPTSTSTACRCLPRQGSTGAAATGSFMHAVVVRIYRREPARECHAAGGQVVATLRARYAPPFQSLDGSHLPSLACRSAAHAQPARLLPPAQLGHSLAPAPPHTQSG